VRGARRQPGGSAENGNAAAVAVIPIEGIGEVRPGDEIAVFVAEASQRQGTPLRDGDCLVVTQKVVSKAENRLVRLDPDDLAARRALVESESVRIVRRRGDLIISETRHGFVCANAGVDLSNVERGWAALLPVDADRSAKHIRDALAARVHIDVAVIISDTFGRPWRRGLTDVAIGVHGIAAVVDLRDTTDALGRPLQVTEVAIADEIASAAELVMGKAAGVPAAIVRGVDRRWFRNGSVRELVRPVSEDLFR
jgi:coenzyme F420-0:L-glutamate ligase/coenzyme F420-1:gamma-L-glutamate ligase